MIFCESVMNVVFLFKNWTKNGFNQSNHDRGPNIDLIKWGGGVGNINSTNAGKNWESIV